ncbi:MAG: hypothetical protein HZA51_14975 [Planctomycetes bacterium]|nr:hypothetical protein [Planctomycetota bacterium]
MESDVNSESERIPAVSIKDKSMFGSESRFFTVAAFFLFAGVAVAQSQYPRDGYPAKGNQTRAVRGYANDAQPMQLVQADDSRSPSRQSAQTTDEKASSTSETKSRLTEDPVTARQSVDSYCSLEDGQPGDPGTFELQLEFGWLTTSGSHDPALWRGELQYNPDGTDFLRNMQLTLGVPLEMGLGGVQGNGDIELGWQQR